MCAAVCCSVFGWLQRGLHRVIVGRCKQRVVLQCVVVSRSVLQCVAVCCSVLGCIAVCCSVLQCLCAAVCCSVM